jgi:hypothetical protein
MALTQRERMSSTQTPFEHIHECVDGVGRVDGNLWQFLAAAASVRCYELGFGIFHAARSRRPEDWPTFLHTS